MSLMSLTTIFGGVFPIFLENNDFLPSRSKFDLPFLVTFLMKNSIFSLKTGKAASKIVVRELRDIAEHISIEEKFEFELRRAQSGARGGPHISAPRQKFKNRLGTPESTPMKNFSPKNEPIRPRGLSCRGVPSILMDAHFLFRALL